jgi:pimeloyl-ACP methyl ester carboxylesterase
LAVSIIFLVFIGAALALGALAQAICAHRDRRRFPPPGRLVNGFHVRELGSAGAPIGFEAGIAASCLGWLAVQTALASEARTWSYDRRGLGWSAPSLSPPGPRLGAITDELRTLLNSMDVPRPFVLVSHSFGALVATLYASRFPDDVCALVYVDPVTPTEWLRPAARGARRLRRAVVFTRLAGLLAVCGLVRLGLWGLLRRGRGNPGRLLGLSGTLRRIAVEMGKLPPNLARALRARWCEPAFFNAMAANIQSLPACAAEAAGHQISRGIPVTVLSGGHQPPARLAEHAAMATRHVVVEGSAHWIHLDRPEIVCAAIREVARNPGDSTRPMLVSSTE